MKAWKVILLILLVSYQFAIAGTKPIAKMPDYNGTYYGTPNTGGDCDSLSANCDSLAGRKMFTTLYRDNYSRTSGCAGEGCGKHPGVDISVASGTPVNAVLGGKIVSSMCDWNGIRGFNNGASGWGGLVIIESENPYTVNSKVYTVYAHLDKWDLFSKGEIVPEGQIIGYSGGSASTGKCPGASSGAHLHFQIDKNYPYNGKPWYPTGRVEESDDGSNPEVPQYTHNPLPFALGYAYNFTFAEKGNKELWGAVNVTSYNTANSDLWIDSSSSNAYIGRSSYFGDTSCGESDLCSREITLDADVFKLLVMNINFKCVSNPVIIYYRKPDNIWRAAAFNYSSAQTYALDFSSLSDWKGIVTDIMIRPSKGCTASPGPEEYFIKQMYLVP